MAKYIKFYIYQIKLNGSRLPVQVPIFILAAFLLSMAPVFLRHPLNYVRDIEHWYVRRLFYMGEIFEMVHVYGEGWVTKVNYNRIQTRVGMGLVKT